MYKKAEASFWAAEEIDLAEDTKDWERLTDNERYFLKHVLAFFAASDGIVNENCIDNFASEFQVPEIRCFYNLQSTMENIHSEMYSLLIETFIKNPVEKDRLFNALETMPCVTQKANFAFKFMKKHLVSLAERLVAFACFEGILFSGSFCAFFWLKKRGLMPGLCMANTQISKDEGLHCDYACMLYNELKVKLPECRVHEIIQEAVNIECFFISEAIPVELIGMNCKLMTQYIRFCADRLCRALGVQKIYNVPNPFDWMELISIDTKINFFERRVTDYSKAKVSATAPVQNTFSTGEDF